MLARLNCHRRDDPQVGCSHSILRNGRLERAEKQCGCPGFHQIVRGFLPPIPAGILGVLVSQWQPRVLQATHQVCLAQERPSGFTPVFQRNRHVPEYVFAAWKRLVSAAHAQFGAVPSSSFVETVSDRL